MNNIRLLIYFPLVFIIIGIFILADFTGQKPGYDEAIHEPPDFHTFKGLGIRVATYPPVSEVQYSTKKADILLLRISQINSDPNLNNFAELGYKNIIFLCDEKWVTPTFQCDAHTFISNIEEQNILVDQEEDISVGYIRGDSTRYFLFPEFLVVNALRYPDFLNLTSSIANSQNIENEVAANNIEIGKQNGISFFPGAILAILFLYLIIICTLNLLNDMWNKSMDLVRDSIPFISFIPFIFIFIYTATSDTLPYLKTGAKLAIERTVGINSDSIPNSVWLLGPILLVLIGFEFNQLFLRYKTTILKYTHSRLNPKVIKIAIILILCYSLFSIIRNTEPLVPLAFLNSLFFSFFLFILYITMPSAKIDLANPNRFSKIFFKTGFLLALILFSGFTHYYSYSKVTSKNKVFFDPPKKYFTVPYSKIIRPYEVYHEYNVHSTEELFIDDYIISHPAYDTIEYGYEMPLIKNAPFAYLLRDEKESVKSILNEELLGSLETKANSSYFRIQSKGDISSKVKINLTLLCTKELNSSTRLEKFRPSYDKKEVIAAANTIYAQRKCIVGEEYKINIEMRLADISTYAYNDEIFKISSDSDVINVEIISNDPNTKIAYLSLKKTGNYIFSTNDPAEKLQILSAKPQANNMVFKRIDNKINLGESINLLKRRGLISNVVRIDSMHKYTLVKYIK